MNSIVQHNRPLKSTREGFGDGLLASGLQNNNVVAVGADITASTGVSPFAGRFPDRFFSMGIAEQNCVGVAAGLALMGKIPVFTTYAVFSAMRTLDQIRISVCYNHLHVIIGGAHAGISVGPDGATHQALEDIAVMRSLPGMTVLSPCDATQAKLLTIQAISNCTGPVYIRFGREPVPDFTDPEADTRVGKAQRLREGRDLTIIATGHMVREALRAAVILQHEGVDARVVNIHTIKPIDKDEIIKAAFETAFIITAEEHQVTGGLGSAVAEIVVQHKPVKTGFIGMPDCFGESGLPGELMDKYNLNSSAIVTLALTMHQEALKT